MELERQVVISKVDQPTDWRAPVVAVPESNGDIRVCIDLTKLNDQLKQETLVLPSIDDVVSQLSNAKFFSKLDANSGFYQIEITPELALLKTFITTSHSKTIEVFDRKLLGSKNFKKKPSYTSIKESVSWIWKQKFARAQAVEQTQMQS